MRLHDGKKRVMVFLFEQVTAIWRTTFMRKLFSKNSETMTATEAELPVQEQQRPPEFRRNIGRMHLRAYDKFTLELLKNRYYDAWIGSHDYKMEDVQKAVEDPQARITYSNVLLVGTNEDEFSQLEADLRGLMTLRAAEFEEEDRKLQEQAKQLARNTFDHLMAQHVS
jgi:hypothetical protein